MIVETQSLTTVGVGAAKVQPEVGDSVIRLPNVMLPNITLMEPTVIFPDLNVPQSTSFIVNKFVSRTNQASVGSDVIRLGKGLWALTVRLCVRLSFAAPLAFNTNGFTAYLISPIGGVSNVLLTLNPDQTGYFQTDLNCRLLLRDTGLLGYTLPATGAADFIDSNMSVVGEKLL